MNERAPTPEEASQRIEDAKAIFDAHATMAISTWQDGEPWLARVFFVEDEPDTGRLDMCSSVLVGSRKLAMLSANPRVAFLVGGDVPDRWIQGIGVAEAVHDDADGDAIRKRLSEKSEAAGPFLRSVASQAIRIHVERIKLTDVTSRPPVTEFTFA